MDEQQLIALIEKMLADTHKGLATKKEFLDVLATKVAEHETFKKHIEAMKDISTLKDSMTSLADAVKGLKANRMVALKTPQGMYNGMWGDLETAKTAGEVFLATIWGNAKSKAWCEAKGITLAKEKAMGEDVGTTGGYTVPTELIPNVILLLEKYGVFRRNALEYPMGSDSASAPKLTSGLTVYCPGAGVAPTASDLAFGAVGMNAKKWITLTALDSELDEDSAIAIGELIGYMIAYAFAKQEDKVGFLGDGTSTYFGHVGIAGALRAVDATISNIKSLFVGSGNLYSEIVLTDLEGVCGIVPDYADDGNLKWFVNRKVFYTVLIKLALAAGGATATEITEGAVTNRRTYLGYPVEFTAAMPKTEANSQICAVLGNLKQGAYLGDRRKITIDRSTEAYFTTDQIGIRGTERVAPTVHGVGDTTDAGPICGLITAAS